MQPRPIDEIGTLFWCLGVVIIAAGLGHVTRGLDGAVIAGGLALVAVGALLDMKGGT